MIEFNCYVSAVCASVKPPNRQFKSRGRRLEGREDGGKGKGEGGEVEWGLPMHYFRL